MGTGGVALVGCICQHAPAMVVLALLLISQVHAATLSGTVTAFESREPVAQAQVELSINGQLVSQLVTGPKGGFSATIPGGVIEIRVVHADYALLVDREVVAAGELRGQLDRVLHRDDQPEVVRDVDLPLVVLGLQEQSVTDFKIRDYSDGHMRSIDGFDSDTVSS